MDPALFPTPLNVQQLLRQFQLSPRKSLGQNFLVDNHALEKVVDAAEIMPEDAVLEIGAGLGSLTRFLARAAARVTAVELDQHLLPVLENVLRAETNVNVVAGDILEAGPDPINAREWLPGSRQYSLLHYVRNHPAFTGGANQTATEWC